MMSANPELRALCPRRAARGFSLVELIVVIGIIGFLMAMILPILSRSREEAQRTVCANQLRQIGHALMMYSNDFKGSMPSWSGWHVYPHGSSPYDEPGLGWVEEMEPYLSPTSPVYNCPSFPARYYNYFLEAEWAGVNGRHATRFTDIQMNSRFIIVGECTSQSVYPPPYGNSETPADDDDRDDYRGACLLFPDDGGFLMHRSGNNILFDDVHVEPFKAFDPTLITFHPRKMASWDDVRLAGPDSGAAGAAP